MQLRSSDFVLNRQSLLRNRYSGPCIEMIYRDKVTESKDGEYVAVNALAFSSTGKTIYMTVSSAVCMNRIMAWGVSNWKLKAEKEFSFGNFVNGCHALAVLRGGVLIATSRTLELWNLELSYCKRQWSLVAMPTFIFAISDDQVLCTTFTRAEEFIVNTVTGDIVSAFAFSSYKSIACYGNLLLLGNTDGGIKLQLLGQSVPRWEISLPLPWPGFGRALGCFSPKGQFIVVGSCFSDSCTYVLDAFSGNVRCKLSDYHILSDFKFMSDEEFIILSYQHMRGASLRGLFNARSGDVLSILQLYTCELLSLATCPGEGLIAICSRFKFDLKVIKVNL